MKCKIKHVSVPERIPRVFCGPRLCRHGHRGRRVVAAFFNKQMTQILVLHHRVAIKRHSPISFQFSSYASLDGGAVVVPALFLCPFLPLFFATSSAIAIQIVTEQVSKNTLWHLYGQPIQAKTSPGSQLNLCPGGDLVGISYA